MYYCCDATDAVNRYDVGNIYLICFIVKERWDERGRDRKVKWVENV
jgi:hypothetical protein